MNRPGTVPQNLRGMPQGYAGQQPQQPGRTPSNRMPNGKIANNSGQWNFGTGMPMGASGLQNPPRQLGGNLSFAQSLSGAAQPATSLDPSEFPSLSSNNHMSSANQSSLWAAGGSRAMGNSTIPLHHQDDLFSSASRLGSAQNSLRRGNQSPPATQPPPTSTDDFPPLSNDFRNGTTSDFGRARGPNMMSNLGFGAQSNATPGAMHGGTRSGNGLLNALSANSRSTDVRSPDAVGVAGNGRPQDMRSVGGNDEPRQQKPPGFRDDHLPSQATAKELAQLADARNPLGAIGSNDGSSSKPKEDRERLVPPTQDPLESFSPSDKWGIKGLRSLMHNYPDYNALVTGMDPVLFGIDHQSPAPISSQVYSLYNEVPPRPAVPDYRLPECYTVNNVQPLENKIGSLNEETLMWIFYSCCQDVKQELAAVELNTRNWRWHKKLKVWLTKDELMQPRMLSNHHEEGYYIIWNTSDWRKERRTMTLHYADLETKSGFVA